MIEFENAIFKTEYGCIVNGDCLNELKNIPDKSIHLIFADLPYGVTARNKWDVIIPFDDLWLEYKRIIRDNGAIVLTGKQPFTSMLIMSNREMFKYTMVWRKNLKSGHLNAKKRPMVGFEDIAVFYKKQPTYNPQIKLREEGKKPAGNKFNTTTTNYGEIKKEYINDQKDRDWINPDDVLEINCEPRNKNIHPTQKPVLLAEYIVKTYTNEGDIVLDNTAGSCTTGVACEKLKRKWVCVELEKEYCLKAMERFGG